MTLIEQETVRVEVDLGDMESLRLRLGAIEMFDESWAVVKRLAPSEASNDIKTQDYVNSISMQGRDITVSFGGSPAKAHVEFHDIFRCVLVLYDSGQKFPDLQYYPLVVVPMFKGSHSVPLYEWDGNMIDLPTLLLG